MSSWSLLNSWSATNTVAGTKTFLDLPLTTGTFTAGQLLAIIVADYSNTFSSITDDVPSSPNVYTIRAKYVANGALSVYIVGCVIAPGGEGITTLTANGTAMYPSMAAFQLDPGGGTVVFGLGNAGHGTNTNPASGTITPVVSANVVIGACCVTGNPGTVTLPPGSPFTQGPSFPWVNSKAEGLLSEYALNQGSSAIQSAFVFTNSTSWACAVASWYIQATGISAITPDTILQDNGGPVTLTIAGIGTNFTSGSTVTIQNSVSGTTSVVAGTWTALTTTSATLQVTAGPGTGSFTITIDGFVSPAVNVANQTFKINALVSSNGLIIFHLTDQSSAANGDYPLQPLNAIGSDPTIKVNGSPVSLGPATTTATTPDSAMVAYKPASAILSTDTVTYSLALAGFVTPVGSSMEVVDRSVSNQVGVALEGPVGTFKGFQLTPTMPMGGNFGAQPSLLSNNWFPAKNLMKIGGYLAGPTWKAVSPTVLAGYDADGYPTTWTPGGTLNAYLWQSGASDGVDGNTNPIQWGTYAIQYDDPSGDKTFRLGGNALAVTINGVAPVTGGAVGTVTTSGGVVTVAWDIQPLTTASSPNNPNLVRYMTSVSGTYNPSGSPPLNLWAFTPADSASPDRSDSLASSAITLSRLKTPSGNPIPSIRTMDWPGYGGRTGCVYPSDLLSVTAASWNSYQQHNVAPGNWSVRFWNTDPSKGPAPTGDGTYGWVSQKVYGPQTGWFSLGPDSYGNYCLLAPSDGGQVAQPPASGNNHIVIMELVSDQPHGFAHGHYITQSGSAVNINISDGQVWNIPGTWLSGYSLWITGPNSIAVAVYWGGSTAPSSTTCLTIDPLNPGPFTTDWVFTQIAPANPGGAPEEYVSRMCADIGGSATKRYVNLHRCGSPDCHTTHAQRVASGLAANAIVLLEYGNEHWNSTTGAYGVFVSIAYMVQYYPIGTILFGGYYAVTAGNAGQQLHNYNYAWALAAAQAMDLFIDEMKVIRPDVTVKRLLGGRIGDSATTSDVLAAVAAFSLPAFDDVIVAPYMGFYKYGNDATFAAAANPASGGWPVAQLNDLLRFYVASSTYNQGLLGAQAGVTSIPQVAYECALSNTLPSLLTDAYYAGLVHDMISHPSYYQVVWCYFLTLQQGCIGTPNSGIVLAHYFNLFLSQNSNQADEWFLAAGLNQPPGYGLSNQYATAQGGSPADGKSHYGTNESVALQALRDWIDRTAIVYTLSGPMTVYAGNNANFVITPNSLVASDSITFSDGGHGGIFMPSSLTLSNSSHLQYFTYYQATPGTYTINLTSSAGYSILGSPWILTVSSPGPGSNTLFVNRQTRKKGHIR